MITRLLYYTMQKKIKWRHKKKYCSWSFSLLVFSVAYDFAAQDKFDKKSPVLD